ncbi:hypothetical protein DJ030_00645 [bacterium endosymbiont of Escarpia laminata]|nr:MAG: hypothetical protein DJ030_00645 [bacterium endosymbiont of Escarpia laminata]
MCERRKRVGIAITLREFLESHDTDYEVIDHQRTHSTLRTSEAAHIPGDKMAKSILLGDDESYLMVVIPASHRLELRELSDMTGRDLELIDEQELTEAFADCEPGAVPPVGKPYGIETLVEKCLVDQTDVFFETGDHTKVIHVSGTQFRSLMDDAQPARLSNHL